MRDQGGSAVRAPGARQAAYDCGHHQISRAPGEFIEAISRVAGGGTVLDPEVVRQLLRASRRADSLSTLTPREKEVLSLMATPLPWRSLLRRHQPGWIPTAGRTGRRVNDGPGLR